MKTNYLLSIEAGIAKLKFDNKGLNLSFRLNGSFVAFPLRHSFVGGKNSCTENRYYYKASVPDATEVVASISSDFRNIQGI